MLITPFYNIYADIKKRLGFLSLIFKSGSTRLYCKRGERLICGTGLDIKLN